MALQLEVNCPQRVLETGENCGYRWVIGHNDMGFRLGYLRIPEGHPWYRKHYDDIPAEVHGGLTYAEYDTDARIEGEPGYWWIGFDCGHAGDAPDINLMDAKFPGIIARYKEAKVRNSAYVEREIMSLIAQAIKAEFCGPATDGPGAAG